jgi:hypothetical protein
MRSLSATSAPRSLPRQGSSTGWPVASPKTSRRLGAGAALVVDGCDVTLVEAVLAALEARCGAELAALRAWLTETLRQPGATLRTVLATLEREWFQGEGASQAHGCTISEGGRG